MNYKEIIEQTEKFVKENIPKSRIINDNGKPYLDHIFGVRKYALKLASIYNADKFVVEMAALLHDIGADAGEKHAKESANIAQKFLDFFDIPNETKELILKCIRTHSIGSKTETIEQQIIQDADGLAFLESGFTLFFEKYKQKYSLKEAREISINKTKAMLNKIKTEEGKKLAKQFIDKALKYLENIA